MTGEDLPRPGLNPRQAELLGMFREVGARFEMSTPGQVHAMDQGVSFMRDKFTGLGARLETEEDYFFATAGLNVGTVWASGIVEREPRFTITEAVRVLKVSLDRMAPAEARRFDAPMDPAKTAWYDQATAAIRNLLSGTMGLDLANRHVFNQISAGMVVGTEWMEGLSRQGYPPDQAAEITCAAFAKMAPEKP